VVEIGQVLVDVLVSVVVAVWVRVGELLFETDDHSPAPRGHHDLDGVTVQFAQDALVHDVIDGPAANLTSRDPEHLVDDGREWIEIVSDDDHGHGEAALGPIDWAKWSYAILGGVGGVIVLIFFWAALS